MFLATQNELLTTKGASVALDALNTIFTLPRIRSMAKEEAFLDLRYAYTYNIRAQIYLATLPPLMSLRSGGKSCCCTPGALSSCLPGGTHTVSVQASPPFLQDLYSWLDGGAREKRDPLDDALTCPAS